MISILGMARDYGTEVQMEVLQDYLKKMEGLLADPALQGYQRFNHEALSERVSNDWRLRWTNIKLVYMALTAGCFQFFVLALVFARSRKSEAIPQVASVNGAAKAHAPDK